MERIIKFRGLREEYNSAWHESEWVYGNLLNNNSIGEVGYDLQHYKYAKVKTETIGQLIRLKDINEIDIYENDLIERTETDCSGNTSNSVYEVVYFQTAFCLKCIKSEIFKPESIIYTMQDLTIIGNRFQNPELLNSK